MKCAIPKKTFSLKFKTEIWLHNISTEIKFPNLKINGLGRKMVKLSISRSLPTLVLPTDVLKLPISHPLTEVNITIRLWFLLNHLLTEVTVTIELVPTLDLCRPRHLKDVIWSLPPHSLVTTIPGIYKNSSHFPTQSTGYIGSCYNCLWALEHSVAPLHFYLI